MHNNFKEWIGTEIDGQYQYLGTKDPRNYYGLKNYLILKYYRSSLMMAP